LLGIGFFNLRLNLYSTNDYILRLETTTLGVISISYNCPADMGGVIWNDDSSCLYPSLVIDTKIQLLVGFLAELGFYNTPVSLLLIYIFISVPSVRQGHMTKLILIL